MIVIASMIAAILMVWNFSLVRASCAREAVFVSGVWLLMNRAPDILVLIGSWI